MTAAIITHEQEKLACNAGSKPTVSSSFLWTPILIQKLRLYHFVSRGNGSTCDSSG